MSAGKNDAPGRAEATGDLLKRLASRLASLLEHAPAADEDDGGQTLEAETLLVDAAAARASDVHLDPLGEDFRLRFRIDGQLLTVARLDAPFGRRLVNQLRAMSGLDPIRATTPASGSFSFEHEGAPLDVRVSEAPCIAGDKLAVRLLGPSLTLADIRQLGLPGQGVEFILRWIETVGGMLVAAGPTGSGKTTTLYTLLHQLKAREAEVVTLEDPVEYAIAGINQLSVNPEAGLDFATGARGVLRLDPDYIVIGELRDPASAEAAVNAASGGRATMTTLHARDAVDAVAVLQHLGLSNLEIVSNLDLVIAQRLVRRICGECREVVDVAAGDRAWLASLGHEGPEVAYAGIGCSACSGLGYRGRVGLFELWRPGESDCAQVVAGAPLHELRGALAQRGHRSLLDDGLEKAAAGIITLADLQRLGLPGALR